MNQPTETVIAAEPLSGGDCEQQPFDQACGIAKGGGIKMPLHQDPPIVTILDETIRATQVAQPRLLTERDRSTEVPLAVAHELAREA